MTAVSIGHGIEPLPDKHTKISEESENCLCDETIFEFLSVSFSKFRFKCIIFVMVITFQGSLEGKFTFISLCNCELK